METVRNCTKCQQTNVLDQNTLLKQDVYTEFSEYRYITYFICPYCGEINVVQIDDMHTRRLFGDLKTLIVKTAERRLKGEEAGEKAQKRYKKLSKQLDESRMSLEELSKGLTLYDNNKNIIVKDLTFPKGSDIIESDL